MNVNWATTVLFYNIHFYHYVFIDKNKFTTTSKSIITVIKETRSHVAHWREYNEFPSYLNLSKFGSNCSLMSNNANMKYKTSRKTFYLIKIEQNELENLKWNNILVKTRSIILQRKRGISFNKLSLWPKPQSFGE